MHSIYHNQQDLTRHPHRFIQQLSYLPNSQRLQKTKMSMSTNDMASSCSRKIASKSYADKFQFN